MPQTFKGLSLQEHNPDISNKSLESKYYDDLSRIFRTFHELGTLDEVKRALGKLPNTPSVPAETQNPEEPQCVYIHIKRV